MSTTTIHAIPLSAVVRDSPANSRAPFNPRNSEDDKVLVESIQALGQIYPVCLWLFLPGKFQIVYGHRRIAALRHLGRDSVDAVLWDEEPDPRALMDAYVVENAKLLPSAAEKEEQVQLVQQI